MPPSADKKWKMRTHKMNYLRRTMAIAINKCYKNIINTNVKQKINWFICMRRVNQNEGKKTNTQSRSRIEPKCKQWQLFSMYRVFRRKLDCQSRKNFRTFNGFISNRSKWRKPFDFYFCLHHLLMIHLQYIYSVCMCFFLLVCLWTNTNFHEIIFHFHSYKCI